MNILGDFITRVNNLYPTDMDNEELNSLLTTIKNQEKELEIKDKEIEKLHHMLERLENAEKAPAKPKAKTAAAPKTAKTTRSTTRTTSKK